MGDFFQAAFDKEFDYFLKLYKELLSFPTISVDPSFRDSLDGCSEWLSSKLRSLGGKVEKWAEPGHPPVLFANFFSHDPRKPTLLIYNHYDVQPVDPLDLWETPPFSPTLKGDKVFARGASDNKGQLFYSLVALEIYLRDFKSIPFNLKWLIEGEEESGSGGLHEILRKKKKELRADAIVVVDVGVQDLDEPALTLGVRGLLTMDLHVKGPKGDLHSGTEGGVVLNPIHHLVKILADCRNERGEITIPDFYEDVVLPENLEIFSFSFDEKRFLDQNGVPPEGGEKEFFLPRHRSTIRPTLEVNGIKGGYNGSGFKTVIPSSAMAKVSCRLVPNQNPAKIGLLIKNYFERKSVPGAEVQIDLHGEGGEAVRCDLQSQLVEVSRKACFKAFGKDPVFILDGGSIPIAAKLKDAAEGDLLFLGVSLPSDAIHAPNEHFSLSQLKLGISLIGHLFQEFSQI